MTTIYGAGGYGDGGYGFDAAPAFDELTEYYIDLLIIQYRRLSNARNTTGLLVQESVAGSVANAVRDGFDLDTAVGAQLDILAQYRGAQRVVFGLDLTKDFFAMPGYDDLDPEAAFGFAEYGDTVTWYWALYADANQPLYAMTDDELRRLIKFLAETQSRNMTLQEIDNTLFEFFGTNVQLTDNGDMTMTYTHSLGDPDRLFTIVNQTGNLPKPSGVRVIVT